MTNNQHNQNNLKSNGNVSSDSTTTAAKLAVLGGLLSTLGDAISTTAAVLELQELQQTENNNSDKINELEKQIQYLTKEINQQKKRGRSNSS